MSMRSVVQKAAQCWSVAHAAEGFSFARYLSVSTQTFSGIPHSKDGYVTHPDLLNEAVKRTQYAVRGELYLRAMQLQKEGMKIIFTNGTHNQHLQHVSRMCFCAVWTTSNSRSELCNHVPSAIPTSRVN